MVGLILACSEVGDPVGDGRERVDHRHLLNLRVRANRHRLASLSSRQNRQSRARRSPPVIIPLRVFRC